MTTEENTMHTLNTPHGNTGHGPAAPADASASLRSFAALLWRRRLIFMFILVLVSTTVAIGLTVVERQFTATARVAATPPPEQSQSPANYVDLLGTMADVAESRPVLLKVREAVGNRTLTQLRDSVTGSVVTGTVLIQVTVTDPDPVMAARIANTVVDLLPAHDPTNGAFVFRTTEPAAVPISFTSPNIKVTLLAGVLLALGLATAAAVAYDRLARTVQTPEEVVEFGGTSVLGVVRRPEDPDGVPALEPESPEFPSLRALRVALEFASSENPTRTLVVSPISGSDPWAGWLEVNLAVALAEVGHRVLLIDADRSDRPRHDLLRGYGSVGGAGLYDLLSGSATLEQATIPGPVEGVTVVPLGNPDLAAPSLLEMRFRQLLPEINEKYDVILIHAASVSECDDARIMSIDGAMLVTIPMSRVKTRTLQLASAHLRDIRIRVVGGVLLGVRPGKERHRIHR